MADFENMTGLDLLGYCKDDASKWAEAFSHFAKELGHEGIDEGWMLSWFANAIEHSCYIRSKAKEHNNIKGGKT